MPAPSSHSTPLPQPNWPLAYFLTFHTYGTWLHGDNRGSVDRKRSELGDPIIDPNPSLHRRRAAALRQDPLILSHEQRECVDRAMRETCSHRGWTVHALNVRTNHVHVVVSGHVEPERILGDLKRWATRRLRQASLIAQDRLVWSEHGSTRWLWDNAGVAHASAYTLNQQE